MFDEKANELIQKAQFISSLGSIYDHLIDRMHWDCMEYHASDDEHDEPWFTEYEDCADYVKCQYKAYKAVLDSIEKLAR